MKPLTSLTIILSTSVAWAVADDGLPKSEEFGLPDNLDPDSVDKDITNFAKLWGWNGCSNDEKGYILAGLKEASIILVSDGVFYLGNHWHDYAAVEFLGLPLSILPHRKAVQHNFSNAFNFQQHWYSYKNTHVFCHDNTLEKDDCSKTPGPIVVRNDWKGDKIALGFCDSWFRLKSLKDAFDSEKDQYQKYDVGEYENRGRAWITAMMLVKTIGTHPKTAIGDKPAMDYIKITYPGSGNLHYVTSAAQAKFLAKLSRDDFRYIKTQQNPDNYAWYALAAYVQGKIGEYPWRPLVPDDLPSVDTLKDDGDEDRDQLKALADQYQLGTY